MIVIYTTDDCPRCKVLKDKLTHKGIEFTESHDFSVIEKMGFTQVPIVYHNDHYYTFKEFNTYLNNIKD